MAVGIGFVCWWVVFITPAYLLFGWVSGTRGEWGWVGGRLACWSVRRQAAQHLLQEDKQNLSNWQPPLMYVYVHTAINDCIRHPHPTTANPTTSTTSTSPPPPHPPTHQQYAFLCSFSSTDSSSCRLLGPLPKPSSWSPEACCGAAFHRRARSTARPLVLQLVVFDQKALIRPAQPGETEKTMKPRFRRKLLAERGPVLAAGQTDTGPC